MNIDPVQLIQALAKRVNLLEDALEAHDDILSGLIPAVVVIAKRTKATVGCDAATLIIYGPGDRIRPLPASLTHIDLGRDDVAAFETIETEENKATRLRLQNAILELRKLRAARLERHKQIGLGSGARVQTARPVSTMGGLI